ncbi:hypothetical protein [Halapricum salinum]|nr:hypothetical protein [Halapricum salinum]
MVLPADTALGLHRHNDGADLTKQSLFHATLHDYELEAAGLTDIDGRHA